MSLRASVLLLGLASLAAAEDEIFQTVWILKDDELFGWPDPDAGDELESTFKPFLVFKDFAAELKTPSYWKAVILLCAGPTDLASLCDPERHLRKLNHNIYDEWIQLSGYDPDPVGIAASPSDDRRAFLDLLLMWRLAEQRGLKGMGQIAEVSRDERQEAVFRRSAADIAAALAGEKPPRAELPRLQSVPSEFDILCVVDERRIPAWRDRWGLLRRHWVRNARLVLVRVGLVPRADICAAQWVADKDSEMFYEFARRFGNARIDRALLALKLPEDGDPLGSAFLFQGEGTFETKQIRRACAAAGVKIQEGSFTLPEAEIFFTDNMVIASHAYPKGRVPVPADLAKLGLGGDDAIWIHCRKVPFANKLPVEGIESLTIRAHLQGGVTVRAEARFRDEASARKSAEAIGKWKAPELEIAEFSDASPAAVACLKAFLASLALSVDGATVVAQWSAPGETPESLLAGVIDLKALYDDGEGEAEEEK